MSSPYLDGLKMLARRELSEAQVRQRLSHRGHTSESVDQAVERLKSERAIDDTRVAEAIARTQISVKGRGPLRVRRQIESAGISATTAAHVVDEAIVATDGEALLQAAISRRLRRRDELSDDAVFARLYRYLIGQGFEHDHIMKALKTRRAGLAEARSLKLEP